MDNNNLNRLLQDRSERQFWLKTVGPPQDHPDWEREETRTWEENPVETHFGRRLSHDFQSDIIIAYRVRIRKLIYIAQCNGGLQEATAEQIQRQAYRQRWRWSCWGTNLTPDYGRIWNRPKININPFVLGRQYSEATPNNPVNLRPVWGNGIVCIPRPFAELLVRQIQQLPPQ